MTAHWNPSQRLSMTSPAAYVIRVRGRIDERWSEYFDDFSAVAALPAGRQPEMVLYGRVRDQAALFGMLHHLCQFGATLISVECLCG
jgi:hypothetical protein